MHVQAARARLERLRGGLEAQTGLTAGGGYSSSSLTDGGRIRVACFTGDTRAAARAVENSR